MPRATPDGMKVCSKCKENKSVREFYKLSTNKDGFNGECKVCIRVRAINYQAANRDKVNEVAAAWRAANREKVEAAGAAWRAANREKARAAAAAWRATNPEKVKAAVAAWRAANPEKVKAARAAWQVANIEKARVSSAAWRAVNTEKTRHLSALEVAELKTYYVAKQLGLPTSKVPSELIELKRLQILIKREIKQQEQIR